MAREQEREMRKDQEETLGVMRVHPVLTVLMMSQHLNVFPLIQCCA